MVAAQPAMTSMYTTPATYAQAPTMTSMYATPGASMYMPAGQAMAGASYLPAPTMVETIAAPTAYAAPTTMTASYVTAPQVTYVEAAPQYVEVAAPAFSMPVPVKLTTGLVEPATLEQEKAAYGKALDAQLQKQSSAVLEEAAIKKKMVDQQAKTQLAQFQLQMEEQVKMSNLQLDQEAQQMCTALQEAAITQQTARDEQTAIQIADYLKKKAMEDYAEKAYGIQKTWFEQEQKMAANYQAVMMKRR